jgi:hypothetical protein
MRHPLEDLVLVNRIHQRSDHRKAKNARQVETAQFRVLAQPGDVRREQTDATGLFNSILKY